LKDKTCFVNKKCKNKRLLYFLK